MGACCGCQSNSKKDNEADYQRHGEQIRDWDHTRSASRSRSGGGQRRRNDKVSTSPASSNVEDRSELSMIMYVALFDYVPSTRAEVALKKGDRVQFLSFEPENFVFVRAAKEHGTRGYVAKEYLARQGSRVEEGYVYGELSRNEATKILMDSTLPRGTFLVRASDSDQSSGSGEKRESHALALSLAISVKDSAVPAKVHHYRIRKTPSGEVFIRPQTTFRTVEDLLKHYQSDKGAGDVAYRLTRMLHRPVPQKRHLPQFMRDRWQEIPREELELSTTLGEGRFGAVRKAIWKQPSGKTLTVVAKQLKELTLQDRKLLLDEAGTMKDLHHENVVRLYGVVSASEPYFLVTEFVKDGSLQDYLRSRRKCLKPPLPASALTDICSQIARGMTFIASKRLVHRDLASRNVLVDVKSESPFSCIAKVADFGLARTLNKEYVYRMKPETDIWAFGVTMAEIFCGGDDPWGDLNEREVTKRIMAGRGPEKPLSMPPIVYEVMKRCFRRDPTQRPKFAQLAIELEGLRSS